MAGYFFISEFPVLIRCLLQSESVKCGVSVNGLFSLKPVVLIICVDGEEEAHDGVKYTDVFALSLLFSNISLHCLQPSSDSSQASGQSVNSSSWHKRSAFHSSTFAQHHILQPHQSSFSPLKTCGMLSHVWGHLSSC